MERMPSVVILAVDKDGVALSPLELFNAWVKMAHDLAGSLPAGSSQDLCSAVYEAVSADVTKEREN
jgi:hypothetical protein